MVGHINTVMRLREVCAAIERSFVYSKAIDNKVFDEQRLLLDELQYSDGEG